MFATGTNHVIDVNINLAAALANLGFTVPDDPSRRLRCPSLTTSNDPTLLTE